MENLRYDQRKHTKSKPDPVNQYTMSSAESCVPKWLHKQIQQRRCHHMSFVLDEKYLTTEYGRDNNLTT